MVVTAFEVEVVSTGFVVVIVWVVVPAITLVEVVVTAFEVVVVPLDFVVVVA